MAKGTRTNETRCQCSSQTLRDRKFSGQNCPQTFFLKVRNRKNDSR